MTHKQYPSDGYKEESVLRELYHEKELSLSEIGSIFDIHISTVHYHMEKNGVERRSDAEGNRMHTHVPYATHYINNHGHELWSTQYKKETSRVLVHRLLAVAEYGYDAIVGNDVHHKNGIPWDNRPSNIEVKTHGEHMSMHNSGEGNPSSKLDKSDVREIKQRLKRESANSISGDYDVTAACIRRIENGETWVGVGKDE